MEENACVSELPTRCEGAHRALDMQAPQWVSDFTQDDLIILDVLKSLIQFIRFQD
jgi:hypothetical protein